FICPFLPASSAANQCHSAERSEEKSFTRSLHQRLGKLSVRISRPMSPVLASTTYHQTLYVFFDRTDSAAVRAAISTSSIFNRTRLSSGEKAWASGTISSRRSGEVWLRYVFRAALSIRLALLVSRLTTITLLDLLASLSLMRAKGLSCPRVMTTER